MRRALLLILTFALVGTQASSWFASETPHYTQWSAADLKNWLEDHHINVPSSYSRDQLADLVKANWNSAASWSQAQYAHAQQAFRDLRESSFDAWDESRLRNFLLEQGVVEPSGPRENLVLLAKQKYRGYQDAASSLGSQASASVSTAIYGDATYQASKSLSSIAAQATKDAARMLDNTKDYVYSTWSDSQLENYLREEGVLKDTTRYPRQDLLAKMQDAYAKATVPVWESWSDSYMQQWLVDHNIIKSDLQKNREALLDQMTRYYYSVSDNVWSTWSDSELKAWLVDHNVIKSDAQLTREKLIKLLQENYTNAADTIWSAWSDSDMRAWLIEHGHLKSEAQAKRDELIKLMNSKYNDASTRLASYLVWPDARLRAYLRERGLSEEALPTGRPSLLQEVRIRWVQTTNNADALFARIKDIVNGGVEVAEESLSRILEILGVRSEQASQKARETYDHASEKISEGHERLKGEL